MAGAKGFSVYTKFAVKDEASGKIVAMGKSAEKMSQSMAKASKGTDSLGKTMGFFKNLAIGAAIYKAGEGLLGLATMGADAADSIMNLSASLGISTDALQQYRYIALQSGMTTDDMDTALTKLTVNLGKNFEEVDAALYQIGLSAEGLRAAGPERALEYIAEGFANSEDSATKAAVATSLFGKANVKMTNILNGGAKAVKKMRGEADAVGYTMKGKMLTSANDMNTAMDKLKATATGLGYRLGSSLAPALTKIIDKLQGGIAPNGQFDGIIKMASSLGGLLGNLASGFFDKFADFATKMGPSIEDIIKNIEPLIQPIMDLLDPLMSMIQSLMPIVTAVVGMLSKALKPIIDMVGVVLKVVADFLDSPMIKGFIDFYAKMYGAIGDVYGAVGGAVVTGAKEALAGKSSAGTYSGYGTVPMSPQTAPLTSSTKSVSESRVTITTEKGTKATADKPAPGVTLSTGPAYSAYGTRK